MTTEEKKEIDKRFKRGRHFTYISDPGHAWLIVTHAELQFFGIEDSITPYSYMDKAFVYLEEDQDAVLFYNKFKARYGYWFDNENNNGAHIRDKDRYDKRMLNLEELSRSTPFKMQE